MGPILQVNISDPNLIKEILLNYEVFQKTGQNPLGKLLVRGVLMLDGEKWVKHRNLLNPAFHLEKLKVVNPNLGFCLNTIGCIYYETLRLNEF